MKKHPTPDQEPASARTIKSVADHLKKTNDSFLRQFTLRCTLFLLLSRSSQSQLLKLFACIRLNSILSLHDTSAPINPMVTSDLPSASTESSSESAFSSSTLPRAQSTCHVDISPKSSSDTKCIGDRNQSPAVTAKTAPVCTEFRPT